MTRRTATWRPSTVSPNSAVLASLTTLRDRSRAAIRNDGIAKSIIDKLVSNMIGTGIKPLSQVEDPQLRKDIHALWTRWTDESDADGRLDFYGQQCQVVRTWLEGGDAFARMRYRFPDDGLSVPLQVQILEPELVPHTHTATLPNGNKVRAGIEFNAIGKTVFYHFHPSRPGDADDFDANTLRRVPAESVCHVFDPIRAGLLRGVPVLTQALVKLYELDQFDDATLLGQKLSNMVVGFLTTPTDVTNDDINPLTGESVERSTEDDKPLVSLEPGMFQKLDPGEDVKFNTPPAIPQTYPDFMRQQLMGACISAGVPYEVVTNDMRNINDRTVRVILHDFRRRIQAFQHQIVVFQFCRKVWAAWMDQAFMSGALALPMDYVTNPEPYRRVRWIPQGFPYLQPVQDVEAQTAAVRAGFTSRDAIVSEQGEDAENIDAENASGNLRAEGLGLVYDSNAKYTSKAGLTQARPSGSEVPEPNNEGAAV